jgi:hypothetical protein
MVSPNHNELTPRRFLDDVLAAEEEIRHRGWTLRHYGVKNGDGTSVPLCHTVGLDDRDTQPEVAIVGVPHDSARVLLEHVASSLTSGRMTVIDGAELPGWSLWSAGQPFAVSSIDTVRFSDALVLAQIHCDPRPVRMLQLLWRDDLGRLPSEPGYSGDPQPVLR